LNCLQEIRRILAPERRARKPATFGGGRRAIADVERKAIAVRKNMERLRPLREARKAEGARTEAILPPWGKGAAKEGASE
jgi:hypothetical protein